MTLASVTSNAVKTVKHNSPVILTGLAVGGVVTTVVMTARAAIRSQKVIDLAKAERPNDYLTTKDKVVLIWPYLIPPVLTGITTIACVIGAQSVNARRQAALVGAFTITEGAFQEYKEKVVEALGKQKETKVRDEIIQQKVNDNPPELVVIGSGNVLCLDTYTGRYFESSMEKIRSAQNDFNEGLLNGEMYMSLNELYHFLGLPDTVVGEQVGFSPENMVKIEFSTAITEDGRPCLAIEFRALPRQDYFRFQ